MYRKVFCCVVLALATVSAGVLPEDYHLGPVPTCPEPFGEQAYAHPDLCDTFFKCTNGSLTIETCENGLLFDGKGAVHNHCNYNWAVECGTRKVDYTPLSTPGCEYQFGIYPVDGVGAVCSTNYIKCAYGEPIPEACEPGLVYDERTHGCNWPDLLLEKCNPEAVVGFKCPTSVPHGTPAARFWPFPRFAVPGDCSKYITCVEGHPRLIGCGEDKHFDASTLACDEPQNVACGGHF